MTELSDKTSISVGLIVAAIVILFSVIGGVWVLASAINSAKTEIVIRLDRTEDRVASLEKNKETWTDADMFRWAVHLQRENQTLKVPEPEMHSNR